MKKYIIIGFLLALITEAAPAATFSGDRLRQGCLDFVGAQLGEDARVAVAGNVQDQTFDEDDVTAEFVADKKALRGNTFVQIEFRFSGKLLRRVQIPVRIKIYREVPVAAENIGRDSELSEDVISYQKVNVTYYSDGDFPEADEIIGAIAERNISKGTIITKKLLREEGKIQKGSKVSIILDAGDITIRAYGTAMQDAAIGSEIRISRDNSITKLQGPVARAVTVVISKL